MDDTDLSLQKLIDEACSHQSASLQRRKALNRLFRAVYKSRRTWRGTGDFYEEALAKTMMYVSEKLCESYDTERGSFFSWFNTCLRSRYKDEIRADQRKRSHRQSLKQDNDGELIDPLDQIASGIDATLLVEVWDAFVKWLEDDPDTILQACHVEGNSKANCQFLAYLRLFLGKEWKEIAMEVGSPRGTVSTHWCRKCDFLMREWFEKNQRLFGEENYDQ